MSTLVRENTSSSNLKDYIRYSVDRHKRKVGCSPSVAGCCQNTGALHQTCGVEGHDTRVAQVVFLHQSGSPHLNGIVGLGGSKWS